MRTYELVMIITPDLDEDGLNAIVERVQGVLTDNGGELVTTEHMGHRKLAYPIRKRTEGHYVLIHAQLERQAILELERFIKLSEDVLRHLLVRLDEI